MFLLVIPFKLISFFILIIIFESFLIKIWQFSRLYKLFLNLFSFASFGARCNFDGATSTLNIYADEGGERVYSSNMIGMKKKKVLSKVVPFAHLIIYSHFVVILWRQSEKSMNKKEKLT